LFFLLQNIYVVFCLYVVFYLHTVFVPLPVYPPRMPGLPLAQFHRATVLPLPRAQAVFYNYSLVVLAAYEHSPICSVLPSAVFIARLKPYLMTILLPFLRWLGFDFLYFVADIPPFVACIPPD